jgi:syntaxin 16
MTRKVRQADENINQLTKIKLNSNEEDVKENIKLNLATKLKEFSRDFKLNEEKYMKNYQELVGEKTSYEVEDLDGSSKKSKSSSKNDFLQLSMDSSHKVFRQRDEEISTLLSSITELASVFKDLQTLVHHQGTILDRIDYNIDNAHQNVKSAHKELIKTEKIMKNSCYRNSMMIIIILIFILSVLIVLKFTS